MIFNNVNRCYNRITPTLAEIALQRVGCPKSIAKTHTIIQWLMHHYIKTGTGVSTGFIKFSPTLQVMGGMGIMDFWLEQIIYAFNTMLGHMRRKDKALGQAMEANLYETQVASRISN